MEVNILYVITNSRIGGAENFLLRLAEGMKKRGHSVYCAITHETGGLHTRYEAVFDGLWLVPHEYTFEGICEAVQSGNADIVHFIDGYDLSGDVASHMQHYAKFAQSIYMDITAPVFASCTSWQYAMRKGLAGWSAVFSETKGTLDTLGIPTQRPHLKRVINNGVDTAFWTPGEEREDTVCWVGRITRDKGAEVLLKTIKHCPDIPFHVVANEPKTDPGFLHSEFLASNLPNLRYEWSLDPQALREVYRSSKVYLHTSLHEAQPGTLLEAMACGCVPVAGAVGGIPDILTGTHASLQSLDYPGAVPERLYGGGIRAALRGDLRGIAPRERVLQAFSLERTLQRYEESYKEMMACACS